MTAADPQHWYEKLIAAQLRGMFTRSNEKVTLTQVQQEADLYDDGDISFTDDNGEQFDFLVDERTFWHVYEKPVYNEQRGQWLARFRPSVPSSVPYRDLSYGQVLKAFRNLADMGVKPDYSLWQHILAQFRQNRKANLLKKNIAFFLDGSWN